MIQEKVQTALGSISLNQWHKTALGTVLGVCLSATALAATEGNSLNLEQPEATPHRVIELPIEAKLQKDLMQNYQKLLKEIPDYKPRTEHLAADGKPHYVNRLIREDSPYLLQHAHNPVNWYSWGDEAFEAANASNKPIFLSVGYATCHWCHVMEREVFEDVDVAEYLNENFIAIKVDREQHPDVDETFMTAVQMMTGGGGWPLSAWLTPDSRPFYGGTYFPKETFYDLSTRVTSVWTDSPDALKEEARKVASALAEVNKLSAASEAVGDKQITETADLIMSGYDDLQGGFGPAPKFPRESSILFLLEQARATGNSEILEAAHFTLQRIAAGGIHDHLAGGFHRYAVDDDWQVPHFEKMLYNQAYLAQAYLLSYELTGDWEHARIARRTLDYVLREMQSPEGLFYSATDADSEGVEGKFFVWSPEDIDEALNVEDAKFAKRAWRVSPEGNFEGHTILHHDDSLVSLAREMQQPVAVVSARLDNISEQLLTERQKRIPPLRDEKIITGWNGMVITALANASRILSDAQYLAAASKAATVLLDSQLDEKGNLFRIKYNGRRSVTANQTDYALLSEALIALHDSSGEKRWLDDAKALVDGMNKNFLDKEGGGYFMGASQVSGATLPVRPKSLYDNATPSGTSVALRSLAKLYHRTGDEEYFTLAESIIASMAGLIERSPPSFSYFMIGVDELYNGENGAVRSVARGKVKINASYSEANDGVVELTMKMADGWHINAHKPLQSYLIGTEINQANGDSISGLEYPKAITRKLGFDRNELALYEGDVSFSIPVEKLSADKSSDPSATVISFNVNLQACNDTTCLAPETVTLDLSTATPDPVNTPIAFADD